MAVDQRDTNGAPVFLSGEALDTAADLTTLGEEIYERGTRLIGTTAERTGYDYPVEGLGWYDTDLDREFVYDGSGWVDLGGLDTGYVPFTTFGSGWSATTGYTPWLRRVGNRVEIGGAVKRTTTAGGIATIVQVPEGFRITSETYPSKFVGATVTDGGQALMLLYTIGSHYLQVTNSYATANLGSGVNLPLAGSWFVD